MQSSCLTDADLLALAEGLLEPPRKSKVDEHLDACHDCRKLLAEVLRAPREVGRAGVAVGRYILQDVLGAGGMGLVYRAWDPQLERHVALKILRSGRLGERGESEILAEARNLARLNHPNVVAVYDAGADNGLLYLVMELIDGQNLRGFLADQKRRDWNGLARTFSEAARGLSAVHEAGLVHRDVKPENVLVGRDGRVRVTDFGLASAEPSPTQGGRAGLDGTPLYLAPERITGQPADARSDQWAFCLMMVEALVGDRSSSAELLLRLRQDGAGELALPAGSIRPPRRIMRALAQGLESDPRRRLLSMRALVDALEPRRSGALWVGAGIAALAMAALLALPRAMESHRPVAAPSSAPWPARGEARHSSASASASATPSPSAAAVGTFRWIEIATGDAASAKRFYSSLFGWTAEDAPHSSLGTYTTLFNSTGAVGGLYQITSAQKLAGRRPHWLPYLYVSDVEESTRRAQTLGARILTSPTDTALGGRLAVVRDPGGAAIALWHDLPRRGATAAPGSVGSWVWHEREASDAAANARFYEGWLGWKVDSTHGGTQVLRSGDHPIASIVSRAGQGGSDSPWIVHFAVANCDALVARALALGAKQVQAPAPQVDLGCRAVLRDPEGVLFAVVSKSP
jgi:predicted enzyme related to lactoylglutathione lyase